MSLPLHTTCNLLDIRKSLFDPKSIDCVLPKCSDKRFSSNHLLRDSSSLLRTPSISDTSLPVASKAESSA